MQDTNYQFLYCRETSTFVFQRVMEQVLEMMSTQKAGETLTFSDVFPLHSRNLVEKMQKDSGIFVKNKKEKELIVDTAKSPDGKLSTGDPRAALLFMILLCSMSYENTKQEEKEELIPIITHFVENVFHNSERILGYMLFGLSDDPVCVPNMNPWRILCFQFCLWIRQSITYIFSVFLLKNSFQNLMITKGYMKSLRLTKFFNNNILCNRATHAKRISDFPGVARLIQTFSLLNRIAITFATFWVFRNDIEDIIENKGCSLVSRKKFYQQLAITGFYFKGLLVTDRRDKNEDMLFFARHFLKLFHAGLVGQSIIWLTTSTPGMKKLPREVGSTKVSVKSNHEKRLQLAEYKTSRLYKHDYSSLCLHGEDLEKQDEKEFEAMHGNEVGSGSVDLDVKEFISNFYKNRSSVVQMEMEKIIKLEGESATESETDMRKGKDHQTIGNTQGSEEDGEYSESANRTPQIPWPCLFSRHQAKQEESEEDENENEEAEEEGSQEEGKEEESEEDENENEELEEEGSQEEESKEDEEDENSDNGESDEEDPVQPAPFPVIAENENDDDEIQIINRVPDNDEFESSTAQSRKNNQSKTETNKRKATSTVSAKQAKHQKG